MSSNSVRVSRAVVAIALATPVSAPALAAADYYLKLEGVKGEATDRSAHEGEIEVQSFSWGASQPSHAGGGSGGMGAGKVSMQDLSVMRGPRQTTSMDGVSVATGDVDGDGVSDTAAHTVKSPRDSASGQASGKRTHNPVKIEKPLEKGSIMLKMALPGCAVGTQYPSAEVTTPHARYMLQDMMITSCPASGFGGEGQPMDSISLNYTKITVRAWDATAKKE